MRARPVEPVHCASHCNQINGSIRQRGRLGASLHNLERRLLRCQFAACFQHLGVRLDCDDAMPGFEKDLRQHAGAGADIRNHGASGKRAMLTQKRNECSRGKRGR